jgi:hypothetical protein
LECQGESPGNIAWGEGEAKGEPLRSQQVVTTNNDTPFFLRELPVADAESRDTIRHLDDDKFTTALHLARFTLPDLCDISLSVERSDLMYCRLEWSLLTPAVAVFMPVPIPATTLPTIICRCVRGLLFRGRHNYHLWNSPRGCLDNSTDCDDGGSKEDLPWSSEPVAGEDGAQSTSKTAQVVDGGHCALCVRRRMACG